MAYRETTNEGLRVKLEQYGLTERRTLTAIFLRASRLGLGLRDRQQVTNPKPTRSTRSPDEIRALQSANQRAALARHGHPRGMLGKRHSAEVRARLSAEVRKRWADPSSTFNSAKYRKGRSDALVARLVEHGPMLNGHNRGAGGRRQDLDNMFFRSRWEANYARYLNLLVKRGEVLSWEYEPKTFTFDAISRGTRAYTPDFRVVFDGGRVEWHEVKGWMDQKSRTRLARMAKYFPAEIVRVIDKAWFRSAAKSGLAALLVGWETNKSPPPGAPTGWKKCSARQRRDGAWLACRLESRHGGPHFAKDGQEFSALPPKFTRASADELHAIALRGAAASVHRRSGPRP